jgi:hypothetical protein
VLQLDITDIGIGRDRRERQCGRARQNFTEQHESPSASLKRSMADDRSIRGAADRSRINMQEDYEIRYWTRSIPLCDSRARIDGSDRRHLKNAVQSGQQAPSLCLPLGGGSLPPAQTTPVRSCSLVNG